MRLPFLEAHDGPMFINYEIAKALICEHQSTLRHEARQYRLGRRARRSHHSSADRPAA